MQTEYSASEMRKLLQQLFPTRRLVLSQFTFYNQCGVAKPSGNTFKRGRRCYKLVDMLPIATVLALKEEGIPLKNIEEVPDLIREKAERIFQLGPNCRLFGHSGLAKLMLADERESDNPPLESLLDREDNKPSLFWSFDIGLLARQLQSVAYGRPGQNSIAAAA